MVLMSLLGVALAAGTAGAQPSLVTHWSLEARIAAAETVVIGTIIKVQRKVLVAPGQPDKFGVVYPDGQHKQAPVVKIDEVLKGNLQGVVDNLQPRWSLSPDLSYDQWGKAGNKILWFLGPAPRPGQSRRWDFVVFGKAVPYELRLGGQRRPPMYAMDFTVLHDEKAILARARPYARTSTRILPTDAIRFGPPWHDLIVPVEPALEPMARRLIAAPQTFVPMGEKLNARDRYQFRFGGVKLLRHFKSEANIALLKSLLADPLENFEPSFVPPHPVRVKAFEVLLHWGLDAPLPKPADEVTRLDLADTAVTDGGLKVVARLKNLETLDLSGTSVTARGLKELGGLKKLGLLELGERQLGDANLRALRQAGLLHVTSAAGRSRPRTPADVKEFSLVESPVTDAGLKELADMKNITRLDLRDTQVTDAGLKELAGLKKLTTLFLKGTQVTEAGVAELRQALPNCTIKRGAE
jgi:hypothetical protein